MLNIGPQELLLVLIIGLIVVGPKRLPELSRQIGRGLREFRKLQDDVKDLVNLDEVTNEFKGMIRFDGDTPEGTNGSNGSTRRPPSTATAPTVHRSPRTTGSAAESTPAAGAAQPDDASPDAD